MINILFVCLGNICRSPLAEGIFKHKVKQRGLANKIKVDSCGTSGWHVGEDPDKRSIEVAEKFAITLDHKGRQFVKNDFQDFDYIIAMDASNFYDVKRLSDNENGYEIHLIRDFEDNEAQKGLDVPDPYFGGKQGFDDVYDILNRTCENFLDYVVKKEELE